MNGYKIEYQNKDNQVVPHWDEASNIAYDNDTVNLNVQTVQEALETLSTMIDGYEFPEITVDPETKNWKIGDMITGIPAMGQFQWARNNNATNAPENGWVTIPNAPTSTYRYLWMRVVCKIDNQDVVATGTPFIFMEYRSGSNDNTGNANIVVVDSAEAAEEAENHPQANTLYFFT